MYPPEAFSGRFRVSIKWRLVARSGRRRLLSVAIRALASRSRSAGPGDADRFSEAGGSTSSSAELQAHFTTSTGLLVLAALTLFLMNALGGRIWCGYLVRRRCGLICSTRSSVWSKATAVPAPIEGRCGPDDREKRAGRRVLKHAIWLMIAWWTGGAWVLYFADAPTLVRDLATCQAPASPASGSGWTSVDLSTCRLHARSRSEAPTCARGREFRRRAHRRMGTQCHSTNTTAAKPRCSVKKAFDMRSWPRREAGDCIDCNQCVAVCPTGDRHP